MKKIKFEGKLCLNKETVTKLNKEQMAVVQGGVLWTLIACRPKITEGHFCEGEISLACEPVKSELKY